MNNLGTTFTETVGKMEELKSQFGLKTEDLNIDPAPSENCFKSSITRISLYPKQPSHHSYKEFHFSHEIRENSEI